MFKKSVIRVFDISSVVLSMLLPVRSQKFINFLLVIYDILVMCWDRVTAFAHELSIFF